MSVTGWRTSLRLARRTARRSLGRTILIAALIGLPVMGASWVAVMQASTAPSGETLARQQIGTADATALITTMPAITVDPYMASSTTVSYPEPPGGQNTRDPARVDLETLLPPSSRIVPALDNWSSTLTIRTPDAMGNYLVQGVDAGSPLTKGTFRLDQGRMPSGPDEVALSPRLADHLGLLDDGTLVDRATVVTADGHRYAAVGVARKPDVPGQLMLWAEPDSPLVPTQHDAPLTYVVDLPDGTDAIALQKRLAGHGVALTPRAWIVDPPPYPYGGTTDPAAWAAVVLVIGFGVLEIVLLAGTAFAVGARRQTRELGLVMTTGGTETDVRRIVLAQGLFLGLVGAAGGVLVAIIASVLAKPSWERLFNHLIDGWSFPVLPLAGIAAVGLLAGLAAAVVPAITAGRQPPVAALAGRFTVAKGNSRLRRPALVLVALGVGSALIGTARLGAAFAESQRQAAATPSAYNGGITPQGPIAMVLIGITAVVAGLVWLLPNLVAKAASLGRALPLSGRLALRDAARHRHRTGPATAAIMMSVGGTVAMAFALSNSFAAEKQDYVPSAHDGYAVVRYADYVDGQPRTLVYSPGLMRQLEQRLPVRAHYELAVLERAEAKAVPIPGGGSYVPRLVITAPVDCTAQAETCGSTYRELIALDPDYLDKLGGFGPAVADVLRSGRIAIARSEQEVGGPVVRDGQVQVRDDDMAAGRPGSRGRAAAAAEVQAFPRLTGFGMAALVSTDAAAQLGRLKVRESHLELTRQPTDEDMSAAIALLGSEEAIDIEDGYNSHAGVAFIALLSAATVVTLLGVAIAVALSAAEGRADLATLAAVGAQPRRRRNLAAAQAWLIGELGCVLGVLVGGLYGYTAHVAFGSPSFAVPWRELGGILVAVPLFAGALAWLLTRSRLPMVRRVE